MSVVVWALGRFFCARRRLVAQAFRPASRATGSREAALRGAPGVAERNGDVASQALYLRATHGAAAHTLAQLIVATLSQAAHLDAVPGRARLPRRIPRSRRDRVPRTYFLTDVAAVDVRSECRTQIGRNVAAMLDR